MGKYNWMVASVIGLQEPTNLAFDKAGEFIIACFFITSSKCTRINFTGLDLAASLPFAPSIRIDLSIRIRRAKSVLPNVVSRDHLTAFSAQ